MLKTFKFEFEGDKQNFIHALRKNDPDMLYADVKEGHLSATLTNMGNASYRIGEKSNPGEIVEKIMGTPCLQESFDRFETNFFANKIDWNKESAILGPMLDFDSDNEKFTGEFATEANQLITGKYRKPFVEPENV